MDSRVIRGNVVITVVVVQENQKLERGQPRALETLQLGINPSDNIRIGDRV